MTERWRSIPGFDAYEISELGHARSIDRTVVKPHSRTGTPVLVHLKGRPLKPDINKAGYHLVSLQREGKQHKRSLHALVLEAFVGPRPDGHETRHLNGRREDNCLRNLAWGTPRENKHDQVLHGTISRGETHWRAKLSAADVGTIRSSSERTAALARRFGVRPNAIRRARYGKTWQHLATGAQSIAVLGTKQFRQPEGLENHES